MTIHWRDFSFFVNDKIDNLLDLNSLSIIQRNFKVIQVHLKTSDDSL